MEKVNLVQGRFQPFTLGHYKLVEIGVSELNVPSVICCIETTKRDKKHPFLTTDLMPTFKKMIRQDKNIVDIVPIHSADPVAMVEAVRAAGYEPVSWACGTDRVADYNKLIDRYREKANLDENFRVLEVHRTDQDISATAARNFLLNDDKAGFESIMPKIWHPMYDKLRKLMLSINEDVKSLSDYLMERLEK